MKKHLLLLTAAAACSLWLPALTGYADPSVSPEGKTYTDVNWVDGSNLLEAEGENGLHLEDLDQNSFSGEGYAGFFYTNGYIIASLESDSVNSEGLLWSNGDPMIDCRYGSIDVKNGHWAVACTFTSADVSDYDYERWFSGDEDNRYFRIDAVDIYYLAQGQASLTASLDRDSFSDACAWDTCLAVENRRDGTSALYDSSWNVLENLFSPYSAPQTPTGLYRIFTENGLQGVSDDRGNILLSPSYPYVREIRHGLVQVSDGEHEGLVDLAGNVIIPTQADLILINPCSPSPETEDDITQPYACGSYAAFESGGKLGYYDLNGNLTLPASYDTEHLEINGVSAVLTDPDGTKHLIAADGADTVLDEAHSDLHPLYYGSGYLYEFRTADYRAGLLDWHGNELLPARYEGLSLSGDGQYLLAEVDYTESALYRVTYDEQQENDLEGLIFDDGFTAEDQAAEKETESDKPSEADQGDVIDFVTDEFTDIPSEEPFPAEDGDVIIDASDGGSSYDGDLSTAASLLSGAASLTAEDLEGNAAEIQSLLESASVIAGNYDPEISLVIDGASALIASGAGDANSVEAIISSALSAIG